MPFNINELVKNILSRQAAKRAKKKIIILISDLCGLLGTSKL